MKANGGVLFRNIFVIKERVSPLLRNISGSNIYDGNSVTIHNKKLYCHPNSHTGGLAW